MARFVIYSPSLVLSRPGYAAQRPEACLTDAAYTDNKNCLPRLARLATILATVAASTACVTPDYNARPSETHSGMTSAASRSSMTLSSLGPLPHPAAAALQARALQDMNRILVEGDALFDPAQGTACQVSWALDEKAVKAIRAQGYGEPKPPITYSISMVSGACPTQPASDSAPIFAGPVEYIEHKHDRNEISSELFSDTIWTSRISAVHVQGQAKGEETTLRRLYTKTYHRLQSGEVIQQKSTGYDFNKPTYQVSYTTHDDQGGLLRPQVTFSYPLWANNPPKITVTVAEQTAPGKTSITQFEGGERKSLMRMRDGALHGWTDYFDPSVVRTLGSNRQCYQNGQLVKATECPG